MQRVRVIAFNGLGPRTQNTVDPHVVYFPLGRPYDGRWSKTMIGYGIEDTHFVLELAYNYNVHSYTSGNDYIGIVIASSTAIANAKKHNWPISQEGAFSILKSPDGYSFYLLDQPPSDQKGR